MRSPLVDVRSTIGAPHFPHGRPAPPLADIAWSMAADMVSFTHRHGCADDRHPARRPLPPGGAHRPGRSASTAGGERAPRSLRDGPSVLAFCRCLAGLRPLSRSAAARRHNDEHTHQHHHSGDRPDIDHQPDGIQTHERRPYRTRPGTNRETHSGAGTGDPRRRSCPDTAAPAVGTPRERRHGSATTTARPASPSQPQAQPRRSPRTRRNHPTRPPARSRHGRVRRGPGRAPSNARTNSLERQQPPPPATPAIACRTTARPEASGGAEIGSAPHSH